MWNTFLDSIGGVQSLSFGWTRQSGQRWGMGVIGHSRKRRQLRTLVRAGVGLQKACGVMNISKWIFVGMCGII